jgi:LacI family transcriptional regulator
MGELLTRKTFCFTLTTMATIVDVARMAGVSVATVSHTFSAKRPVSPRTRARVRAAAARAGYRPSHIAVSMVTGRTRTIGMVVPDIANPFFSELVRGAEAAAMAAGYMTIVCSSELNAALEDRCVEVLSDKRIDALLYLPGTTREHRCLRDPALQRVPIVVIDEEMDKLPPGATVITSDNDAGGVLAGRHLADLGHSEIGVIAGPHGLPTAEARLRGFLRALTDRGIAIPPERILRASYYTREAGVTTGRAMLASHPSLTAVYCANDLIALGLMTAATDCGRTVGRDLSVAGFDDIFVSQLVTPALTTIRQPIAQLGGQAAELAVEAIEGRRERPERIVLPVELVVRASTAPVPTTQTQAGSPARRGSASATRQGGVR